VPEKKNQNYLHGAAILTATIAIVKILGAVYKIALVNIIGNEGYAHFMVANNIYALVLALSTAGLPVAVSRMISAANAAGRKNQIKRIFKISTLSFCIFGAIGTGIMLLFPNQLAESFGDFEAAKSIATLAPSIFLVCLMSAYRGYTQGHSDMKLTSVSQVIEVLGKVMFGLVFAALFLKKGLPEASAGAITGVTIGSALACLYSAVYIKNMRNQRTRLSAANDSPESSGRILKTLLSVSIPIAIGASATSLINVIDTKLVMNLLQNRAGFSFMESKVLFGIYGSAQTIFNLPSSFVVPLTISVIPAIAAFATQRRHREAAEAMRSSLKITTLLALPAGIGLSVLAGPIMTVLYPESATKDGVALLTILGISSFFVCLCLITNAILQAYGYEKLPILTISVGGIIKIAVVYSLVGNPKIGIYGAAVGTLVCDAAMAVMNLILTKKVVPKMPSYLRIIIKPLICSAVMGAAAYGSYSLFEKLTGELGRLGTAVIMTASIIIAIIVYLIAIIVTKTLTYEDVKLLPKGEKLAKLLRIR